VFDSGVGGLTVLHELLVSLPTEDYLYLGDTARLPYGNKSPEELRAFSIEIADHLLAEGAKLLVVACNSASAAALDAVERHLARRRVDIDVIGVLGADRGRVQPERADRTARHPRDGREPGV
jgi:glutamate racemase